MNRNAVIPLSALVVGGTITFADLNTKGSLPSNRQWLGLASVYLILSLGSDLGFTPANGFAALLMLAVFISRGNEAIGYVSTKAGPEKTKHRKQNRYTKPRVVEERMT